MKNWQKDAQPEWPEVESGASDRSEAGRDADATEVLPPTRPFPSSGVSAMSAGESGGAGRSESVPSGATGSDGLQGAASGAGWFGTTAESPRGHGGPAADRTEMLGSRIAGHGRRAPGQDPLAQGRITWGRPDRTGAHPGNTTPGNPPHSAAPYSAAPHSAAPTRAVPAEAAQGADPFGGAPYVAPAAGPGPSRGARGTGPGPDRTDVLPPAGPAAPAAPTRAFSAPAPAPAPTPAPATAALRDPWQELPDPVGDAHTGPGSAEHTHDPHEVTVQLDAVHLGDGVLLRAEGGHRKSGPEPSDGPVFVDASGRRSRLYRRLGILVGIACAVYAVVIVSTLLSGNSDAPWMPVPGQQEGAPAGQVDTTPVPSQSAQPSGTGDAVPQASPSADSGTATAPGAGAPASGVTGGTAGQQPGTSTGAQTSSSGSGRTAGGSGPTGPDPAQSTQSTPSTPAGPSAPAGGGTSVTPTGPTGGTTPGTDPGADGTDVNGAGDPDPVAGPAGAPVVVAGPADTSTSPSLSPENTL
ncbi:hypothetical protein [Streptomyces sp. NPDC048187]|uniref:hypothetical protein n=1 Tax=Streptomyces sp. NPDC048187 TaxID=3365509 RepID=UPI003722632F